MNGSGLGVGPLWRKMVTAVCCDWHVPHRLLSEIFAPAGLRLEGADRELQVLTLNMHGTETDGKQQERGELRKMSSQVDQSGTRTRSERSDGPLRGHLLSSPLCVCRRSILSHSKTRGHSFPVFLCCCFPLRCP